MPKRWSRRALRLPTSTPDDELREAVADTVADLERDARAESGGELPTVSSREAAAPRPRGANGRRRTDGPPRALRRQRRNRRLELLPAPGNEGIARCGAAGAARVRCLGASARGRGRSRPPVRRATRRRPARRGFSEQLAEPARRRHGGAVSVAGRQSSPRTPARDPGCARRLVRLSNRSRRRPHEPRSPSRVSRRNRQPRARSRAPRRVCVPFAANARQRARRVRACAALRGRAVRGRRYRAGARSTTPTCCCRSARASPRCARARSRTPESAVTSSRGSRRRAARSSIFDVEEFASFAGNLLELRGTDGPVIALSAAALGSLAATTRRDARTVRPARSRRHRDDRAPRRRQRALHAGRGGVAASGSVRAAPAGNMPPQIS